MTRTLRPPRLTAWLDQWGGILPLLVAEFVVWLGFGGLLPVLPLYFTEQGVDLSTLGLVIAAWPAARLVSEPIFGWLADRTARVPLMVVGLLATGDLRRAAPGPHRRRWRSSSCAPCAGLSAAHLRPGRARVPDRRHAARQARRGVRPVRGGADGRPAAGTGDRRVRRGELRRASAFVFVFSAVAAVLSAARDRPARPGDAGPDPPGAVARFDRVPAGAAARSRGRAATDVDADRDAARPVRATPIAPVEPGPDRGHRASTPAATTRAAPTRSSGACSCRASAPTSR